MAGDGVAVLRAAVQTRERLCRDCAGHCDHRGRARGAQLVQTKKAAWDTHGTAQEISTDLLTTSPGLPLEYALIRNPIVHIDTMAPNSIMFSHTRAMLI